MDPVFSAAFEESIDAVFNSIACDFAKSNCLEQLNAQLREEVAALSNDVEMRSQQLLLKDTEILSLNNKIIALTEQRSELICNIDKEMNAQALIVKTTYDVEILQSRIHSLEREIQIQRNENERLNRINKQSAKDLSSRKFDK